MAYTRQQVRDLVKRRCDMENTTAQTNAEINDHINDAAAYVHDFLISTWGARYSRKTHVVATIANTRAYALTAVTDFYKPIRTSLVLDDTGYPLAPYSPEDRVSHQTAMSWGPGNLPQYDIRQDADGTFTLEFDPIPDAIHSVAILYHPTAPVYTSDSDSVNIPHVDLLVVEAARRVMFKNQRPTNEYVEDRAMIQKRIEDWAGSVDMGNTWVTMIAPRGGRAVWRRDGRIF